MDDERKVWDDNDLYQAEPDPFFSVPQAARELGGIATATVLSLVAKGELESRMAAGRSVITKRSIRRYKARQVDLAAPANGNGAHPG